MSTAEVLSSAAALLDTHKALLNHVRTAQRENREALRAYISSQHRSSSRRSPSATTASGAGDSPTDLRRLLELPLVPTPSSDSPRGAASSLHKDGERSAEDDEDEDISAAVASFVRPHPREVRHDLSLAKKARCARYENYIPEEETIRNDYCQRYVDGGEWPQDWVVGAEMERRFEECVIHRLITSCLRTERIVSVLGGTW